MPAYEWYQVLNRPSWAPPSWLFGPVWSVLYVIIAISFGFVLYQFFKKKLSIKQVLPFLLNLVFNLSFTPLQFGLQNNVLALVDILLVLITLIWALASIRKVYPWVSLVNLPYLAWVMFATTLQISITFLN